MSSNKMLMIFMRNLKPGNSFFNPESANEDEELTKKYKVLQERALLATASMECDKAVFYSEYLEHDDAWKKAKYQQHLQYGLELGEKIENAFALAFKRGYEKVVFIGSECYELTPDMLSDAFSLLDSHNVVLGPSSEGSYYLLGMKKLHSQLFRGKLWGQGDVLLDTILDMENLGLTYSLLETLKNITEVHNAESYYKTY